MKDLPTKFDAYEIHALDTEDEESAASWTLFGHVPGVGLLAVGDFSSRMEVEEIYARIIGRAYASVYVFKSES